MVIHAVHPKQNRSLHLSGGAQFDKQIIHIFAVGFRGLSGESPCFHSKNRNSGLLSIFGEI